MNFEIIMQRPSIVAKLFGAVVCAGLSIYNVASSSDRVLIRSANPSSSRTEVRVFESPSKQLNLTSGLAFGLVGCGLIYFALVEYNGFLEELGNGECATQEKDHPQQYQPIGAAPSPSVLPISMQPTVGDGFVVRSPIINNVATHSKSYLKLVPPITSDGTMPYPIPPDEFMRDMEAEDYWNNDSSIKE